MPPKQQPVQPKFACEEEAALLLNCISADEYVEHKCVQYMKRLRKCVQRERIVNFELLPDSTSGATTSEKVPDLNRPDQAKTAEPAE